MSATDTWIIILAVFELAGVAARERYIHALCSTFKLALPNAMYRKSYRSSLCGTINSRGNRAGYLKTLSKSSILSPRALLVGVTVALVGEMGIARKCQRSLCSNPRRGDYWISMYGFRHRVLWAANQIELSLGTYFTNTPCTAEHSLPETWCIYNSKENDINDSKNNEEHSP